MNPDDVITVTVLPDGEILIETQAIGKRNHGNAEDLLRDLATGMGGTVRTEKRPRTTTAQTARQTQ